jgi:hypothetical protein
MWTPLFRGPDWMPITPKRGSFLHADSQADAAQGSRPLMTLLPRHYHARIVKHYHAF